MTQHDIPAIAQRLGMAPREIEDVTETPAGLLVTAGGAKLIEVPESSPDADGKTGLMFFQAPTETYNGTFPVYSHFAEDPELVDDEPEEKPKKTRATKKAAAKSDADDGVPLVGGD